MKCVLPKMAPAEEEYFYSKMDINKDGLISLKEIQFQFKKYDIPLNSVYGEKIPHFIKHAISL